MQKQISFIGSIVVIIPLLLTLNIGCGGGGGGGGGVIVDDDNGLNMVAPANTTVPDGWVTNIYNNSEAQLAISNVAIAADSNGVIHLAYEASQKQGGIVIDSFMAYAVLRKGGWQVTRIDDVGGDCSITIDSEDKVHISYIAGDWFNSNSSLRYATNRSGTWQVEIIEGSDAGAFNSIAVDSNGAAHISYLNTYGTDTVKYATNSSGSWEILTIDSVGHASSLNVTTSIGVDNNDFVHMTYYVPGTTGQLAHATNETGDWQIEYITQIAGIQSDIAIDGDDNLHVSFSDINHQALWYATKVNGVWDIQTIDQEGSVGAYSSIQTDSSGDVHISYLSSNGLKYATSSSGAWEIIIVDADPAFRTVGQRSSLTLDLNNHPHIAYLCSLDSGSAVLKCAANLAPTMALGGQWVFSTANNWSNGCPPDSDNSDMVTILQEGDQVSAWIQSDNTESGGKHGGSMVNLSTSFPEDGGTTVMDFSISFANETSGSGSLNWFWFTQDGTFWCNGGNTITVSKVN